jgi:hypothetical protein
MIGPEPGGNKLGVTKFLFDVSPILATFNAINSHFGNPIFIGHLPDGHTAIRVMQLLLDSAHLRRR